MTVIRPGLDSLHNKKLQLSLEVEQLRQLINVIITAPLILLPATPDPHKVNAQTEHGVRQHGQTELKKAFQPCTVNSFCKYVKRKVQ